MIQPQPVDLLLPPRASVKRRILAIYIDMLIFDAIWRLATLWMVPFIDSIWLRLAVFMLLESVVFPLRVSPGLHFLSVYFYSGENRNYVGVDPEVKSRENWPTMIVATLLVNDGWKAMVRWTEGYPARPYFGVIPNEVLAPLADITLGAAEVFVAYCIFKMARPALWFGLAYAGLLILSTALSWNLFPEYVDAYGRYRAEYLGREFQPEIAEFMTPFLRYGMFASYGVFAGILLLNRKRFTQSLYAT